MEKKEKISLFLVLGESSFDLPVCEAGKWLPRQVLREEEAGLRHLGQREKVLGPGLPSLGWGRSLGAQRPVAAMHRR